MLRKEAEQSSTQQYSCIISIFITEVSLTFALQPVAYTNLRIVSA